MYIYRHMYLYVFTYVYIYIYICICIRIYVYIYMCVCVVVGRKSNHGSYSAPAGRSGGEWQLIWTANTRAPKEGHPSEGPPICRYSHIVLIRMRSKPALYQPQTSLIKMSPKPLYSQHPQTQRRSGCTSIPNWAWRTPSTISSLRPFSCFFLC